MDQQSINEPNTTDNRSRLPHSKAGIASLIIAIIVWVVGIASFSAAMPAFTEIVNSVDPANPVFDEEQMIEWFETYPALLAIVPTIMAMGGLAFLGSVLGIISLFRRDRKKTFPILGTIFNLIPIISFLAMFTLGQALL